MIVSKVLNYALVFSSLFYLSCRKLNQDEGSKIKNLTKTSWYCTARDADNGVIEQRWVQAVFTKIDAERKFRKDHPQAARLYCI